jgi:hypothetical protein
MLSRASPLHDEGFAPSSGLIPPRAPARRRCAPGRPARQSRQGAGRRASILSRKCRENSVSTGGQNRSSSLRSRLIIVFIPRPSPGSSPRIYPRLLHSAAHDPDDSGPGRSIRCGPPFAAYCPAPERSSNHSMRRFSVACIASAVRLWGHLPLVPVRPLALRCLQFRCLWPSG